MEKIFQTDFEFVPPRRVHVRFRGVLDAEELNVVFDRVAESVAGQSVLLVQVEWGEVEKVTPEARRVQLLRLTRALLDRPLPPSFILSGVRATAAPDASSAAAFAAAVPLDPVTIAPAWPIRLPGGASNPAM